MKTLHRILSLALLLSMQYNFASAQSWLTTGNSGTSSATNFLGTIDNVPLVFKVNNNQSGFIGTNTTQARTAMGYQALKNTTGNRNTAFGFRTISQPSTGANNTAMGAYALYGPTTAAGNTALGQSALYQTTTGNSNVAIGSAALI